MAEPLRAPLSSAPSAPASSAETQSRAAILRQLVDVFVLRPHHSPSEIARFEEVMSGLIDQAPIEAFPDLAARLVGHPCAPIEVLEKLARSSEDAAAIVLAQAPSVSPARLAAAVAWGAPKVAAAVAARPDLDSTLATALAMRPELEVGLALAQNRAAPLSRLDLQALVRRAAQGLASPPSQGRGPAPREEEFARALLERLEGEEAAPLFLAASPAQRSSIVAAAMRRDLIETARAGARVIEPDAVAALERAAVRSDDAACAAALSAALDVPPRFAERLFSDEGGEGVALALAALNLTDETRERLLVFLAPGWGKEFRRFERLRKLAALCPPSSARRLLDAAAGKSRSDPRSERPDAALTAKAIAHRAMREAVQPAAKPAQAASLTPRAAVER